MGVVRATSVSLLFRAGRIPEGRSRLAAAWAGGCGVVRRSWLPRLTRTGTGRSPAVVRERLVGFRHAVRLFTLLDRAAAVLGGVEQLAGQLARPGVLAALARRVAQPAHRQR